MYVVENLVLCNMDIVFNQLFCFKETNLKRDVSRLEREAAAARSEARAAEARALQLQRLLDAQAE